MKIVAVQGGGLLGAGVHEVKICKISLTDSKGSDDYTDKTPQLAVMFKKDNLQQTAWYNLKGYKTDSNGNYIVDESGARIEDVDKTNGCMSILGKLAFASGCDENAEIDTDDLIDKTVSITVKAESGKSPYVAYVNRVTVAETEPEII